MVQARQPKRKLDGVLLLDKPGGMSSNAALQAARRLYRAEKAGHTGTLDPLATGLLPLAFGEATKFSQSLLDADKRYLATVELGARTDTGDAEGAVIRRSAVAVSEASLLEALARFRGEIEQVPPMHSALKRDGVPLYALARRGVVVERAPRRVRIHALNLVARQGARLELDVRCSKGTYIRSLADDLGETLGCGAHLAALRRTAIGRFEVADAIGLDALERMDEAARERALAPADALVADLARVDLEPDQAVRFGHGQPVRLPGLAPGLPVRVYESGRFLGIGLAREDGLVAPQRLVAA
ncbi:MAG TPA: tRNA pseudouridine(55) synthase TruB [Rhodocyclaceae bacterium]|jgi:tRNA pseudouridine55 synthase|nr:tRNA pseudouridine(55) synthase TruB [Rhodocyclaceae bacterium]